MITPEKLRNPYEWGKGIQQFSVVFFVAIITLVIICWQLSGLAGDYQLQPVKALLTNSEFKVKRDKIYFGDLKSFNNPAVLEASKIYNKIPAYRKIIQKGLKKDDPEYWPLMRKASTDFVRALKSICLKTGHDLIGEIGSISPVKRSSKVPVITDAVIGAVQDRKKGRVTFEKNSLEDEELLEKLINFPEF